MHYLFDELLQYVSVMSGTVLDPGDIAVTKEHVSDHLVSATWKMKDPEESVEEELSLGVTETRSSIFYLIQNDHPDRPRSFSSRQHTPLLL